MTAVFGQYSRPKKVVKIASGDGDFIPVTCYGLGFDQIVMLVREYAQILTPIYAKTASGNLTADQAITLVTTLIEEVPSLISMTIALGTDAAPEDMGQITLLSVGAKIELVHSIVQVTLASEGGPEKIMEIVRPAVAGIWSQFPKP